MGSRYLRILIASGLVLLPACGDDQELAGSDPFRGDGGTVAQCFGANDCQPGYFCNEFNFCSPFGEGSDAGLPDEVELQQEPPASGKYYVYIAIPDQDRVAKIDSRTLEVEAIQVGRYPVALRTIPGKDVAVVLEQLSSTATVIRSTKDGDRLITLDTALQLNQLALSPGGKYAVAYFDLARVEGRLDPKQNYQEITVLRLSPGEERSVDLSVGFKPSAVQFSADGKMAFVITEQGISAFDLTSIKRSRVVPPIPYARDPLTEPLASEVLVTSLGKLALIRQPGLSGIRVVDLQTREIKDLDLGGVPTDLDLTADGKLAVVVLRNNHQLGLIDIPGDIDDPHGIDLISTDAYFAGQVQLSADEKSAFLFTNATSQEVLLIANLDKRKIRALPLKKGVRAVIGAPDGSKALVLHNKAPGTPRMEDGFEVFVDRSQGYSILNLRTGFDKLYITATQPKLPEFAADSDSAYLLLDDAASGVGSVEAIDLQTFTVSSLALGSPPIALGLMESTATVFAAQSHPLGRITFIEIGNFATRTVTGYELNSHIIE